MRVIDTENIMDAMRNETQFVLRCEEVFHDKISAAAGAIREFSKNGLRTPQDISVMGFDDTSLAEVFLPSITTMRQPQYEIGYQAMELLSKRISGEAIAAPMVILEHKIIERSSVAGRTT